MKNSNRAVAAARCPQRSDGSVQLQGLTYGHRLAVGELEALHGIVVAVPSRGRQRLPILAAGGVDAGQIAAPVSIAGDLLRHPAEQMNLAIDAGENPQRVFASRERGRGVKRRGRFLLTDAGDQRSGEKIARWSEED